MANIFTTATYVLSKLGSISAMKLQKLCYYSQVWSLVWDDEELFPEDFQAWVNGPVCPDLFYKTKGKFKITEEDELPFAEGELSDNQKDTIDRVLEYYGPHDAQWLSMLTHLERPWNLARQGVAPGEPCENVITKASISEYYSGL